MKKYKLTIIIFFVCVLLFNRNSIVYAECEYNNISDEEVYSLLASGEETDAIIQIPEQRASKTAIGLGYGTDLFKGDYDSNVSSARR